MESVNVTIRHQGTKYDIDIDLASNGETFKYQVYSLTGVEPERQKILLKGSQLKDETDMGTLGLKPGQVITVLGTPSTSGVQFLRPKQQIKFVEDMTEAEAAQAEGATPAGLQNLGNTCYLNSTLQTLRAIPELQTSLSKYRTPSFSDLASASASGLTAIPQLDLTGQLRDLYKYMSETQSGFPPHTFLGALRTAFPQFAERAKLGPGFAQQDAEEAWSQIVAQLRQRLKLKEGEGEGAKEVSFVDKYMAGEFVTTLRCDDQEAIEAGEIETTTREPFLKLSCHIDGTINHLRDGIVAGLTERIVKKSAALDRDVTFTKTSKISRLPKYLTVHFVRFFWKRDVQKKAKIMRKVTFPQELDVVEFCSDELKKMLVPVRDKVREIRKEEEDMERARKRRKKNPLLDGDENDFEAEADSKRKNKKDENRKPRGGGSGSGGGSNANDAEAEETYKTDAQVEAEKAEALLTAKKELHALINPELLEDEGQNQSGLYELRGVVTHQGASADSGHYTAYVKKAAPVDPATGKKGEEDGNWWWFNDDKVSEVPADKIATLAGGGESHSALILLYRAIPLPLADGTME